MMTVNATLVCDIKWLTLEVCREFQRGTCSQADAECKFAHLPSVPHGKWLCGGLFDSLKCRCARGNCKYLHPPPHLKTQLEINGPNNLIQQKTAAIMFAQQMQYMFQNAQMSSLASFPMTPSLATNPAMAFSPYLLHPGMGLVPAELLPNTHVLISGNPHLALTGAAGPKLMRSDKLEVCREFQRGNCTRGENDCRYAHPSDASTIEASDNTVTICMDYIKGRCSREKCKYFHPPPHLQAKLKASHQQMNHSAAAAMALQSRAYQLIPKRSALEKTNVATPVFNPNVFHCQQALANLQLPQQPAFIPTGQILCMVPASSIVPMMHGATPTTVSAATTPATTIPFAATATGNQIPPLSVDEVKSTMFLSQM